MQNTGLILRFSYLDYGNQRCQIDQWTQNKLNYSFLKQTSTKMTEIGNLFLNEVEK